MKRFTQYVRNYWLELSFLVFGILTSISAALLGYTHMVTLVFLILFAYTMGAGSAKQFYEFDISRLRKDNKSLFEALERRKNFLDDLMKLNVEKNRGIMNLHRDKKLLREEVHRLEKELNLARNPEAEETVMEEEIRRLYS